MLRIHVAPSKAGAVLDATQAPGSSHLIDWGGGLIWLGLASTDGAGDIMARIAVAGGHPMVVRTTDKTLGTLLPPNPAIAALGQRVKAAFDPNGVFNSGALAGHI